MHQIFIAPVIRSYFRFLTSTLVSKKFTLGKSERLKQRKFIERLFREGKSFSVFPFRVYYLFTDELTASLQAGFTASTRNFKRAVDRNRIKRVTREAYRLQKSVLRTELEKRNRRMAVFMVYVDKNLPAFEITQDRMRTILQKMITILHEMDSSGT